MNSKVVFGDDKLKKAFDKLKSSKEKQLYEWLIRAFHDINKMLFVLFKFQKD